MPPWGGPLTAKSPGFHPGNRSSILRRPTMNTKKVGELTEAYVLAALVKIYRAVLFPFGDNQRYDLVFEDHDGSFVKVQCKTGRYRNGVIIFNSYSSNYTNPEMKSYKGEIDYFGVHCPDFPEVYLVPVNDVGIGQIYLRRDPTQSNKGTHQIRWAEQYLLA